MADFEAWHAFVLAVVQGITEWLPVSSTGHLLLAERLLGIDAPIGYLLLVHAGTLLAVIVAYRARLAAMVRALLTPRNPSGHADRLLAGWVVLGTVPIVIVGLAFREPIKAMTDGGWPLWIDFTITAALLMGAQAVARRLTDPRPITSMRAVDALVIGAFQAIALLPAVSRSGSTLAGAVFRRFNWANAADYAFLLSIPALAGALVLEYKEFDTVFDLGWGIWLVGLVTSAVVGYASIQFLLRMLRRTSPMVFAWYCLALALGLLAAELV